MNNPRPLVVIVVILFCVSALRDSAQTPLEAPAEDTATLLDRGQKLASAGRLAEAAVPLTSALAHAPDDMRIIVLLAEVKSRLGESAEAVQMFRRVVTAQPQSAKAHLYLAIALADTSNLGSALSEVEKAIRLDPGDARAHLNRARMLADAGHDVEARVEFERAARLDPQSSEIEFFWGSFEKDHHRLKAAVMLLKNAVAGQPENGRAYFLLGQALRSLGREADASAALSKAIAIDPSSEEAVYALSQVLRKNDPAGSRQMLQRFNELRSEKGNAERATQLGNQAYAAMQRESWDAAIVALRQAIDICRQCALAADLHQHLGLALCHAADLDAGERELKTALALKPTDPQTVAALEWVANKRKRLTTPN